MAALEHEADLTQVRYSQGSMCTAPCHFRLLPRKLWEQVQERLSANREARSLSVKAEHPSLLAGILWDASGKRLTPVHTTKKDKRYSYYILWAHADHTTGDKQARQRIPAHELEWAVIHGLHNFLTDPRQLLEALPDQDQHRLLESAKTLVNSWEKLAPIEQRKFLISVLDKITVFEDHLDIAINNHQLLKTLLQNNSCTIPEHSQDKIHISIAAQFKRHGHDIRLILPGASPAEKPAVMNMPLIKVMAKAKNWYARLTSGKPITLKEIADESGINPHYVSRNLRFAFLAPDIVETILQGKQPENLIFDRMEGNIPMDWNKQRVMFRFPER